MPLPALTGVFPEPLLKEFLDQAFNVRGQLQLAQIVLITGFSFAQDAFIAIGDVTPQQGRSLVLG